MRTERVYVKRGVSRLSGLAPGRPGAAIPAGGMSACANGEMDHVRNTSGNAYFFRPYPLEPGIP